MTDQELFDRTEIARYLLSRGMDDVDYQLEPDLRLLSAEGVLTADLQIPFPAGLAPIPLPLVTTPDPTAKLPKADVLVITWTVDEQNALADVLTLGQPRKKWYRY